MYSLFQKLSCFNQNQSNEIDEYDYIFMIKIILATGEKVNKELTSNYITAYRKL